MIILTPIIEPSECGFIAWTKEFKGTVVQADTKEGVLDELILSMKVLFSYTFKWNINSITAKIVTEKELQKGEAEITQFSLVEEIIEE